MSFVCFLFFFFSAFVRSSSFVFLTSLRSLFLFLDFTRSAALAGTSSSSSSSSETTAKPLFTVAFVDEALAPTRAFAARARALADLLVASAQFEALGALPPAHAPPLRGLAAEAAALVAAVRERASASLFSSGAARGGGGRGVGGGNSPAHGGSSESSSSSSKSSSSSSKSSSSSSSSSSNLHRLLLNQRRDLDRDLLEAAVGVHSLEVKALAAVDEALAAAPSVEAATTVLASVVRAASSVDRVTTTAATKASSSSSTSTFSASSSPSRSRFKAALLERLQVLLLRYAEHVEGALRREYDSGKADPRPPPGAPRGAGGVLWARGLLERVEGPMKR